MKEWISVSDRLPEKDRLVLVYRSYPTLLYGSFFDIGRIHSKNLKFITHWMPIKPPETTTKQEPTRATP